MERREKDWINILFLALTPVIGVVGTAVDDAMADGAYGLATGLIYAPGSYAATEEIIGIARRAAGGRAGDIVHVAYGYGLFTGGLGAHYGAEKLGCTVIPMSGGMTDRQVQLIVDFQPDIIMVTPSYMLAIIDEMEWRREHAKLSPEEVDRAVTDLIELVGAVDGILRAQASSDADYFLRVCGRASSRVERGRLRDETLSAYRWQYIVSGVKEGRFSKALSEMITAEQGQRIQSALAPMMP